MSPTKRRHPCHIALPPRMVPSFSQDSDASAPSTPSPHTPLPYEYGFAADLAAQHDKNGLILDNLEFGPSVGMKRGRDDPEDLGLIEPEWTDEEIDTLQSTLMHPYRPLNISYPPGELPPPAVIDELANQVLAFAFKPSPSKLHSRPSSITSSPTVSTETSWKHTWDATRKKLFDIALAESKFGQEVGDRKAGSSGRSGRPGLRRVDSMDFLDQAREEVPQEGLGRTMRLSTSLQNTSKVDVGSAGMCRSSSESSLSSSDRGPGSFDGLSTSITVTPSSPETTAPLRRKGSFRGLGAKPQRPTSLLQRGRSFTASDLAAEAEAESQKDKTPALSDPLVQSPTSSEPSVEEPSNILNIYQSNRLSALTSITQPRMTRSQSSSSVLAPPHAARDKFLAVQPSTTDRSLLAMPLTPNTGPKPKSASGWSDSEDEGPIRSRAPKKLKGQGMRQKVRAIKVDAAVNGSGGGLRSPFEEKAEFGF